MSKMDKIQWAKLAWYYKKVRSERILTNLTVMITEVSIFETVYTPLQFEKNLLPLEISPYKPLPIFWRCIRNENEMPLCADSLIEGFSLQGVDWANRFGGDGDISEKLKWTKLTKSLKTPSQVVGSIALLLCGNRSIVKFLLLVSVIIT